MMVEARDADVADAAVLRAQRATQKTRAAELVEGDRARPLRVLDQQLQGTIAISRVGVGSRFVSSSNYR